MSHYTAFRFRQHAARIVACRSGFERQLYQSQQLAKRKAVSGERAPKTVASEVAKRSHNLPFN